LDPLERSLHEIELRLLEMARNVHAVPARLSRDGDAAEVEALLRIVDDVFTDGQR
jgi:hypothetical protein